MSKVQQSSRWWEAATGDVGPNWTQHLMLFRGQWRSCDGDCED